MTLKSENEDSLKKRLIEESCFEILEKSSDKNELKTPVLSVNNLKKRHIVDCVIKSVCIYFDKNIEDVLNFSKRGIYSELRGICYEILRRRGDDDLKIIDIAKHFGTWPSKVSEKCKDTRERMALSLYNYDKAIATIENIINLIIKT